MDSRLFKGSTTLYNTVATGVLINLQLRFIDTEWDKKQQPRDQLLDSKSRNRLVDGGLE